MKEAINKYLREDFVTAFMHVYSSPGIGIPLTRKAYNEWFTVVEYKNTYKVTIRGITKRFSNLCMVGEFIYKENFNPSEVFISETSPKYARKIREIKEKTTKILRSSLFDRMLYARKTKSQASPAIRVSVG